VAQAVATVILVFVTWVMAYWSAENVEASKRMAERMADGLRPVLTPEGGIRPRGEPGRLPPGRLHILGRWRATITLEYRRLTRDFDTRREALAWLAEIRLKADRGLLPEPSRVTVGEYPAFWLENGAKPSVRPPTFRQYEQYVRNHISPILGTVRLQALKPADIQALYARRLGDGLSRRTVQLIHAVLHKALSQAVDWGLLAFNPADRVKAPRPARKEFKVLTPEEARRFLEAARNFDYYPLFVLALTTGMRLGELLGLKWQDIDFEAGAVHVRRGLYRIRGAWVEGEPKSAAGKRKVVLPALAVEALREHRVAQLEAKLKAGAAWEDNGLVFTTAAGRPIHPRNVSRALESVLKRAGLPRIRFHDLRHSHATLLLMLGENPRVVQERLGHSQISLTLQTYSHVLPDLQRQAAEKIDRMLGT
jgi:integrase